MVAVPYTTLLHQPTRESMGIDLAGSIVIFDEAHNVPAAINDMHSVTLSAFQVFPSLRFLLPPLLSPSCSSPPFSSLRGCSFLFFLFIILLAFNPHYEFEC